MSPKNKFPMDIDNRESKKSVVQRFMSSEDEISEEPKKESSSSEQKELPQYNFPTPKDDDKDRQDDETEEVFSDTGRKPLEGYQVPPEQPERPEKKEKEKVNPFVQAKPKKLSDKKNKKNSDKDNSRSSSDVQKKGEPLPDIGENFAPPKSPRNINPKVTVEEVEEEYVIESSEEFLVEEEIFDETVVGEDIEDEEFQDDSPESKFDLASVLNDNQDKIDNLIEEANELQEESSEFEPQFDLESILSDSQQKIDNLIKDAMPPDSAGKAEKIISRAVVRKIIKRAYDYDDQTIAHYLEILEKNDIKTRFYFKNTLEDAVAEEVEAALKHIKNICKCDRCFADICAVALNSLTPHYVTTAMDELYHRVSLLDIKKQIEIFDKVYDAIDTVKNNPSHK